jgi:aminoglycoside/choline kinase family phosphotransferase
VSTDLFDIFSQALKAAGYTTELERLTALVPEASTRRYYRLHQADGQTIVGVNEEPASAAVNMPNVIAVQKFLTAGNVAVPQIFYTTSQPASCCSKTSAT